MTRKCVVSLVILETPLNLDRLIKFIDCIHVHENEDITLI